MNGELQLIIDSLVKAQAPEDIFGTLSGSAAEMRAAAQRTYHAMARRVHPDVYAATADRAAATAASKTLNELWRAAQQKIEAGTYGLPADGLPRGVPSIVRTRKHAYRVDGGLATGDLANLYHCAWVEDGREAGGIFKVARDPVDNDLVANEARVLKRLETGAEYDKFASFIPRLFDSFRYADALSTGLRQANVLPYLPGFYTLESVRGHYPRGIDPKDMAWMWRRLLAVLGFVHANGIIHGAVLPGHILIQPELHGLLLVDWSYAVWDPAASGERIAAISADYEAWYPWEVAARQVPVPGLDLFMGARCMVYVLGGDPTMGRVPDSVPKALRSFFTGCLLAAPGRRPQDAWALLAEFDAAIERLWGPRQFHPFTMHTPEVHDEK